MVPVFLYYPTFYISIKPDVPFQSINAKGNKDYPQANYYGHYSLTMTVLNIFFTLCTALLITGSVVRCYPYYMALILHTCMRSEVYIW